MSAILSTLVVGMFLGFNLHRVLFERAMRKNLREIGIERLDQPVDVIVMRRIYEV